MENSVSLYLHIPFCVSKCQYCDFFSLGKNSAVPDSYVDALCAEIKLRSFCEPSENWRSIYIGGGTPSLLNETQLNKIMACCASAKKITDKTEITIEVNPDDVTPELLSAIQNAGINRLSVGIQSFNEKCLDFAKRRASREQNFHALDLISQNWKGRFSLDLICGLPFETKDTFFEALEKLSFYNPDHVSMYSLTFEDETPFGRLLNEHKIEYDFDFSDDLWISAREFLENHGWFQYEVSNFCKPGFESVHNLSYWNHQSYFGCGAGACGTLYKADGTASRWNNTHNISLYTDFFSNEIQTTGSASCDFSKISETEEIDAATSEFEFFMMGLRKIKGVSESDYKRIFGKNFSSSVKKLAEKWQNQGLCEINCCSDFSFTLGKKGILQLNRFLIELEEEL